MTPTPSSSGAAGFVRLADLLPATVAIEHGGARAVFSARELEARLGLPGLAAGLAALLASPDVHSSSGEERRGEGGGVKELVGSPITQNAFEKYSGERWRSGDREGAGGARGAAVAPRENEIERIAGHLARSLKDDRSLNFYRLVARAVAPELIRDALTRALDARDVRRSRAALFTAIVRLYLPRRLLM